MRDVIEACLKGGPKKRCTAAVAFRIVSERTEEEKMSVPRMPMSEKMSMPVPRMSMSENLDIRYNPNMAAQAASCSQGIFLNNLSGSFYY